jgi:hypothetical protein
MRLCTRTLARPYLDPTPRILYCCTDCPLSIVHHPSPAAQPVPPTAQTQSMRRLLPPPLLAAAFAVTATAVPGAPPPTAHIADDPGEQIPGPKDPSDSASVAAWRSAMVEWRSRMRDKIHFNGSIFEVAELRWTQTSYIQ